MKIECRDRRSVKRTPTDGQDETVLSSVPGLDPTVRQRLIDTLGPGPGRKETPVDGRLRLQTDPELSRDGPILFDSIG